MHSRRTCSIGCPKPRSTPSDKAATSSASRTSGSSCRVSDIWSTARFDEELRDELSAHQASVGRFLEMEMSPEVVHGTTAALLQPGSWLAGRRDQGPATGRT